MARPSQWRRSDGRKLLRLRSLAMLLVAFAVVLLQSPRVDAYRSPTIWSLDWWWYPWEYNAPARLPLIRGNLSGIALDSRRDVLWTYGPSMLLLQSSDGGKSWTEKRLEREPPPTAPGPNRSLREHTLIVRVFDGDPIVNRVVEGALIEIFGGSATRTGKSDGSGEFETTLPEGVYALRITASKILPHNFNLYLDVNTRFDASVRQAWVNVPTNPLTDDIVGVWPDRQPHCSADRAWPTGFSEPTW
jgi:hypothetical protein